MSQSKHIRKALLASVLSVLLCAAVLVGSTFAWFTDSATSGNNKIVAGNLDVELEYTTDFVTWNTVAGQTNLFEENTLWEPGHAEVVYLRVRNAGSLALEYRFAVDVISETEAVNVYGEEFKLSQYLQFGLVDDQDAAFESRDAAIDAVTEPKMLEDFNTIDSLVAGAEPKYLALVVYMPTTVGNEANYRGPIVPKIELGISVTATQAMQEADSFGIDYDEEAVFVVGTADELRRAVQVAPDNSVVALKNNIDLTGGNSISIFEKNLLLDLRGHTLTVNTIWLENYSKDSMNVVIQHGTIVQGSAESYHLVDVYGDSSSTPINLSLHDLTLTANDQSDAALRFQSQGKLTMDQVNVTGFVNLSDGRYTEITSGTFRAREKDTSLFLCNCGMEINGGNFAISGADKTIFDVQHNVNYDFVINDGEFIYSDGAGCVTGNTNIQYGYIQINGGIFNETQYTEDMFENVVTQD